MPGMPSQYFTGTDYLLSLPILMLTVFALGILLIDLIIPLEWKWTNSVTALMGILFSAAGVLKIQYAQFEAAKVGRSLEVAFVHSMVLDHFSIYFYYLFLAADPVFSRGHDVHGLWLRHCAHFYWPGVNGDFHVRAGGISAY